LQPGVVHGGLVGLDRAFELADERLLRVELLLRDSVLGQQVPIADDIDACVVELRLVAGQRALGLAQRRLEGARVDLRERLAGLTCWLP
jgi:hypothetical protein